MRRPVIEIASRRKGPVCSGAPTGTLKGPARIGLPLGGNGCSRNHSRPTVRAHPRLGAAQHRSLPTVEASGSVRHTISEQHRNRHTFSR